MGSNSTSRVGYSMLHVVVLAVVISACYQAVAQDHPATAMLTASQCFNSRSRIPKVMFGCPSPNYMIKISRAFHGVRLDDDATRTRQCGDVRGDPMCTYCEGDCVDASINEVYDWSSCIGGTSCVRTVLQSYAHSCTGNNKFSQYLQVDYQCIPKEDVSDICQATHRMMTPGGELSSPNYPGSYPADTDCLCTLSAEDPAARIILNLYDLVLRTKYGRCRADWLMLRQGAEKHRHCGVLTSGTQNLTTSRNVVTIQFHSDHGDDDDKLADDADNGVTSSVDGPNQHPQRMRGRHYKGFWLRFETDRRTPISVDCRALTVDDPAAVEARADNDDYSADQQSAPPHPPSPPGVPAGKFQSRDNDVLTSREDGDDYGRLGVGPPPPPGFDDSEVDVTEQVDGDLWSSRTTSQRSPRTAADDVSADVHSRSSLGEKKGVLQPGPRTSGGSSWHYTTITWTSSLVSTTLLIIVNRFVHWHC